MITKEQLTEKRATVLDAFAAYLKAEQELSEQIGFFNKKYYDNAISAKARHQQLESDFLKLLKSYAEQTG